MREIDNTAAEFERAKTVAKISIAVAVAAFVLLFIALVADITNKNVSQDEYAKALEKRIDRLESQMDEKNKSPIINGILDRVW